MTVVFGQKLGKLSMTNDEYIKLGRMSYDLWINEVYNNRYDLKHDWPILEFIGRLVEGLTASDVLKVMER